MRRLAFLGFGWLCVVLALGGIVMPVLPTTPFLLVALWAFTRSSPGLADWIREHPRMGHYVQDWEAYGVIPLRAKVLAVLMMSGSLAWLALATTAPAVAVYAVAAVMVLAASYILSRPSEAPSSM